MHEVLVNRLGSLSLPRKSVARLTDRPDMTLDVYRGRKTTMQQQQQQIFPRTSRLMAVKLGILHQIREYYQDCSNEDLALTYFTEDQIWENANTSNFMEIFEDFGQKIGN